METGIVLPDHVIEEILLRLPVKHLLLWKCVSRYWYALIWDVKFVKKHHLFRYNKHLAVHGDVPLLLDTVSCTPEPTQFNLLSKDGAFYVTENITTEFERDTAHVFTGVPEMRGPQCKGVVNGVVCLQEGRTHLVLWNPATREIKNVPVSPIMTNYEEGEVCFTVEGFGFDLQSNDFKIMGQIHIGKHLNESNYNVEYHIYSLKADSWKSIKEAPSTNTFLFSSTTDTYFNNGLSYWTALVAGKHRLPVAMISFNFSSEIFKEFEAPAVADIWVGCRWKIGKYKEGLALLVNRELDTRETCFEIWAVTKFRDDDHEVPSSWQLVVKVPPFYAANGLQMGSILDCGDILLYLPITHVVVEGDGDILVYLPITHVVVEGDGNLAEYGAYICNPSTGTLKYLGFKFDSSYRYTESLFPLSKRLN